MAQRGSPLDTANFCCSVCLSLFRDPVTIHCGHSYCKECIGGFWDTEERRGGPHSCPQCRASFTPRPALVKNTVLAELSEQLMKAGLQGDPADRCLPGPMSGDQRQTGREGERADTPGRIRDGEKEAKRLQKQLEEIDGSADRAVEVSAEAFAQLSRLLEDRRREVERRVRSQQQREASAVQELRRELEQEVRELRRSAAQPDQNPFLPGFPSPPPAVGGSTPSPGCGVSPATRFQDVTAAVSELKSKLEEALNQSWTSISLALSAVEVSPPVPKSRDGFLRYSQEITLDPDTAHVCLSLSEQNRKVTAMNQPRTCPHSPGRFTQLWQVLSRESLSARCYWEVEVRARGFVVAAAYRSIGRAGSGEDCRFGWNSRSWALYFHNSSYSFCHNSMSVAVAAAAGPVSSRLGVYVDHGEGVLSFYSVSDTRTLLHSVQTSFSEPLHAGLWLYKSGDTAQLCTL